MKIRKPWISDSELKKLESRIGKFELAIRSVNYFTRINTNSSDSVLKYNRDSVERDLANLNQTYDQYASCFFFSGYNPNHESAVVHVNSTINRITNELKRRTSVYRS